MKVDPRAVVDSSATLAEGVTVSPFAIVGADVAIGPGPWIGPRGVIQGPTTIGANNRIYQFASVGDDPQDKKYRGEHTRLEIGDGNVIREYATLNRGTLQGGGVTRIGNENWIMAYVHIAHDCIVGDHTTFANGASLAGHVRVDDHAILGGFSLIHQFSHLGRYTFSGMGAVVSKDVPPFVRISGNPAEPRGLNTEGLKRAGFGEESLGRLRQAYRRVYREGLTIEDAMELLADLIDLDPEVAEFCRFVSESRRGILR